MARNPAARPAATGREKILKAVDASEDRVAKVLDDLRNRRRRQRREGNYAGARTTVTQIKNARVILDRTLSARIRAIESDEATKEILAEFKTINADMQQSRDDIKDLAKDLKKISKALKLLTKVLAKVL